MVRPRVGSRRVRWVVGYALASATVAPAGAACAPGNPNQWCIA